MASGDHQVPPLATEVTSWRRKRSTAVILFLVLPGVLVAGEPTREALNARALAFDVNDCLSRYIDVHNYLFKVTPGRIIPIPGIFEAIDFKAHTATLDGINADLLKARTGVTALLTAGIAMSEVREFLVVLDNYVASLADTVAKLRKVSSQLYNKSHQPSYYSWDEYQRDMRAYETAVEKYRSIAESLNPLFARLEAALQANR